METRKASGKTGSQGTGKEQPVTLRRSLSATSQVRTQGEMLETQISREEK